MEGPQYGSLRVSGIQGVAQRMQGMPVAGDLSSMWEWTAATGGGHPSWPVLASHPLYPGFVGVMTESNTWCLSLSPQD